MPGESRSRSRRGRHRRRAHRPGARAPVSTPFRFDAHLHLSRYWPDPATNRYGPALDFSIRGLLAEMDAAGVDSGLLLQLNDAPSVAATLREGAELSKASGGRLLRSSTVDPTKGAKEVSEALEAWATVPDLAALKLYPGYQHVYPHDRRLDPIYEFAARQGIVVLFHQGDTLDPNGLVKFARPIEVDEVAVRYRDVPFVLCHFGNPWFEEAAEVVFKNPNVWADTSGLLWPPSAPLFPSLVQRARRRLESAIAEIGDASRILYGSDWPLESIATATRLVETLDLPTEDRAGILGGNAGRLFRRFLRSA